MVPRVLKHKRGEGVRTRASRSREKSRDLTQKSVEANDAVSRSNMELNAGKRGHV